MCGCTSFCPARCGCSCHRPIKPIKPRPPAREWKPGDVAVNTKTGERLMRCEGSGWIDARRDFRDPDGEILRPLVVIDPDDREQVERLADIIAKSGAHRGRVARSAETNGMQAALREFANPTLPKPDEPQGLGAVVEDAEGRKFVRVADPIDGWMAGKQWQRIGGEINAVRNFGWSDLSNVVRVLSEGVTP